MENLWENSFDLSINFITFLPKYFTHTFFRPDFFAFFWRKWFFWRKKWFIFFGRFLTFLSGHVLIFK